MRTMRAVVCGTRFGQVYLEAFRRPDNPVTLAGILANGSARSRRCAEHYGVPLYTEPDQLPDGIDISCVVIRGGLLGGRGTELAMALMARGVSVLQEHPLHHDELAACLREARRRHVVYQVNSFYPHITPVRRFLAATDELLRVQRLRYVDAACGFQLAYSLLDIVGRAVHGVRPWAFSEPAPQPAEASVRSGLDVPFRSVAGVFAGVPLTLRVQNQLDPADPDNYAHLMHRVTVGTDGGNLTLVSTHGPTVWCARPDFPKADAGAHFARPAEPDADRSQPPSATLLGPAQAPSNETVFASVWTEGVVRALRELVGAIEDGADPGRGGQYHLALATVWQDLTARLGPPELVKAEPPRALRAEELSAVRVAGDERIGT